MSLLNPTDAIPNVASISAGPAWTNSAQSQTFYLGPYLFNTYDANHNTSTLADGTIFLGKMLAINHLLESQLGLAVTLASNANLTGDIWQQGEPQFNNLTYSYKVNHAHVALQGKLFARPDKPLQPYVNASLGMGFNHAYNYTNTPRMVPPPGPGRSIIILAEPNFSSNTQTTFTYTVGIGLQQKITKNWSAGLGYEFMDWGQNQLGRAIGQTENSGLKLSHLYTNSLQCNLTYTII